MNPRAVCRLCLVIIAKALDFAFEDLHYPLGVYAAASALHFSPQRRHLHSVALQALMPQWCPFITPASAPCVKVFLYNVAQHRPWGAEQQMLSCCKDASMHGRTHLCA